MTWVVPVELEDAVYPAARGVVGEHALATASLVRAIADRSRRYTSDRGALSAPADRTADLAARAAFFTVADAMKIAVPLSELARRGALPARDPLRVVDLGAGCGAASLGTIASLTAGAFPAVNVTAIDRDVDALRIAGAAVRGYAGTRGIAVELTARAADLDDTAVPAADVVIACGVLNELAPAQRLRLVERALAAIDDEGSVIVIEPALRDTSRALHEVRDAVLASGRASVFAPCTRRGAPCPALADPDDWCHEDRAVALPPRTAELARLTHLRDGGLKFSYLVLRRAQLPLVAAADGTTAWRVVSAPRVGKGKLEVFGCAEPGRVAIRLLKRARSGANRAFAGARRGDVIVSHAEVAGGRVELAADSAVERVEPAGR